VLAALKDTFHDDTALDFNMFKTNILVKGISAQTAHADAHCHTTSNPALNTFNTSLPLDVFSDEGLVGLGVPLGTDDFVQNFVRDKCKDILEDVDKLDALTDGFIHYQLLRFCQATHLQYINSHVILTNQNMLQQQHVDVNIGDALMRKGTNNNCRVWSSEHKAWCDMVLHLPHAEGGFGVTPNAITRFAAFALLPKTQRYHVLPSF
jgi:hypothetical protein